MLGTIHHDVRIHQLLQRLLPVRHSHLRPLLAVSVGRQGIGLHYGQPGPCLPRCDGVRGALLAVHAVGLWVGDLRTSIGFDDIGRVVLSEVGSQWDVEDPFRGHPSTAGRTDLRVAWRQSGELMQLADLAETLVECETLAG
jgi:hypothetical protein